MTVKLLINRELQPVSVERVDANTTVLEYLRSSGLCGTKEGCAAGDCGACTAVVGSLSEDGTSLDYRSINTCLALVCSLDGRHLISVEGLSHQGELHPVQQAMVNSHGSQCGFCTPGFVMSLFAMYLSGDKADRETIQSNLSGNLCRCTGYAPILEAGLQALTQMDSDPPDFYLRNQQEIIVQLQKMQQHQMLHSRKQGMEGKQVCFYAPDSLEQLDEILEQQPQARLVAGGTDLGLELTQQLSSLPFVIDLKRVTALQQIEAQQDALNIGAAVSLEKCCQSLTDYFPPLEDFVQRFASRAIRNWASLGGNIANASPIADMPPVLLALGASLRLRKKSATREIELDGFFLDYKKTALESGEYIERVRIPALQPDQRLLVYKLSRRYEDDISTVCVALKLTIKAAKPVSCVAAFGGMAEIPRRSPAVEQCLLAHWSDQDVFSRLLATVTGDFTPLSDVRSSSRYRLHAAARLLHKAVLSLQGEAVTDLGNYAQCRLRAG